MRVQDHQQVNILLVDDQPAKLLSYEVILSELGENLIKANSAREALALLLRTDVAVVLIDVCMPELDGFELATMIREHPRFQQTAIIFVSAIQITQLDSLRGYEAGAVDYVPVPVVPEVLRAKVRVFSELHRKTRQLERLNAELEQRVAERTAELEAAAARLRDSEQRRSLALAAGRMGSWQRDLRTDEFVWDDGQYRIFGVDPHSFRPSLASVMALIHPEDAGALRAADERAATLGKSSDTEFRILRPDGEIRWCVASGAASFNSEGLPISLSGVTHDITERKLAETALQQLNEDLEHRIEERTRERETALAQLFEAQKIDTIGQLTGGVAHDFNNLLMAVLGSLELLKKRIPADDARSHRLLDNAVQGADRGAALTQRLLAFARRQELKPEAVEIGRLLDGMEALLERALGPGVSLESDVCPELPPVRVDANQLELAILNLAVNARDAMPSGGSLLIRACGHRLPSPEAGAPRSLPPGDYVRIDVVDTGLGMDETTLARATEPFFTTKGPGKGTGLGLSMVQGLAVQSGGAMTVSSGIGQGTTIMVWLPQTERPKPSALDVSLLLGAVEPPEAIRPGLTVLVVDDDALVSTGTVAMLEDLGFATVEVGSGAQALLALRDHPGIDVVITDHAMPGMTGLELAHRLQSSHPTLPVILASGYAEITETREPDHLPRLAKPFRQAELAAAITAALGRQVEASDVAVPAPA